MKKGFCRIISFVMIISLISTLNITSYSVYDTVRTDLAIDGAPIVIIQDESEIPLSVRRNIEICKQKEKACSEIIFSAPGEGNIKATRDLGISPYVEVSPIIMGIIQSPQDTNYFCGYACLQSILAYHDITKTQTEIANESYRADQGLAWFLGTNDQWDEPSCYPAVAYLNSLLDYQYTPYNWYFDNYITAQKVGEKIKYNVDVTAQGVLIAGLSSGTNHNGSRLPNYPTVNIGHWIIADGYYWETDTQSITGIHYVDPAKSSAISWSSSISAYARTDLNNIYNFSLGNGIIY